MLLTCGASWTAAEVDANSEQRLLEWQTKQAASVLSTAVMLIEQPLGTALSVQQAAPARGSEAFTQFMSAYVGPESTFVSASLWRRQGEAVAPLVETGGRPLLEPSSPAAQTYVAEAFGHQTATAHRIDSGAEARIVWVRADPAADLAIYAERRIPADRRAAVDSDSAYANLTYAIYLGPEVTAEALTTTDADPSDLPLRGVTSQETVPFGHTVLTLVAAPRGHLGSDLSRWLPLGLLLGGVLLTVAAARTGHRLARGRWDAEQDASTITALYEQVEILYGEQRVLFERLQRALLPHAHPVMSDLEIASRYVAGSRGIDIGGDWYSVVALDDHRFAFVVGDVSGRGVDAVAVMAQARFTIRAYLLDGQRPGAVLQKCSHQFDIEADGHLITVLVGIGDTRTGEVTVANAGHPAPVLVGGVARPVEVSPGRPLGTGPSWYEETTIRMPPGSTLFCFTDGLVERRDEDIDAGLRRLGTTLDRAASDPLDHLVSHAVDTLRNDDAPDDVAVLAFRWTATP